MLVGESTLRFELVPDWEQLPGGWSHGDVAGVAVDSSDRVFVFNRGEHPVIIYERDGSFVGSWGEGVFTRPHGITIHDDVVYCADDLSNLVELCALYLEDDEKRETVADAARLHFDRYLERTQWAAYYLHTIIARLD